MHYSVHDVHSGVWDWVWVRGPELGYRHRVVASCINLVTGGTEIDVKSWVLLGLAKREGWLGVVIYHPVRDTFTLTVILSLSKVELQLISGNYKRYPCGGLMHRWIIRVYGAGPTTYVSTWTLDSYEASGDDDHTSVLVLRIGKFQVYWKRIRLTKDQPHSIGKASRLDGILAEDKTTGATQQLRH
jgi:hypothetical protein